MPYVKCYECKKIWFREPKTFSDQEDEYGWKAQDEERLITLAKEGLLTKIRCPECQGLKKKH